jgi:hypothetical protein
MSVVHHALEAVAAHRRAGGIALALMSCIVLVGGCGGSHSAEPTAKAAYVKVRVPAVGPVRTAACSDWKKGTVAQRRAAVVRLRNFAGGPVGSSFALKTGPVVDDERAYRVLRSWCVHYYARGFKLYKLYDRAAAFVGHSGRLTPAQPSVRTDWRRDFAQ